MKKSLFSALIIVALLFVGVFFILPGQTETLSEITGEEANPSLTLMPPSDKIYHAMSPSVFTGWERRSDISLIDEAIDAASKDLAWVSVSNAWFPTGKRNECLRNSRNFTDRGIHFPKQDVEDAIRAGQIPSIRMLPYDRCITLDDEHYKMQNFIDGKFDADLRSWARELKKIPSPVLLTFGVEVNGEWFPWNMKHNGGYEKSQYGDKDLYDGHERFRDAYRHIIDLFREEGVENATWFYHVNCVWPSEINDPISSIDGYYPGDDYIDWIGISCYGSQDARNPFWWDMSHTFDHSYEMIVNSEVIGDDKPIALMEFGVVEGPKKPQWIETFLTDVIDLKYPRLSAISWWQSRFCLDYLDGGGCGAYADLRLESSPESLETYRQLISNDLFISEPRFE